MCGFRSDVYPVTPQGRFVVALEMLAAVTVIPFELTALSRALSEEQAALSRASVDTVGDGVADSLLLDTVGDGRMDSVVPFDRMGTPTEAAPASAATAPASAAAPTRRCTACGLVGHEADAVYCRRCAAPLVPPPGSKPAA